MDVCMNAPLLNNDPLIDLKKRNPYAEVAMIGLGAVGIGILVGIWVVGPALTGTASVASDWATRSIPMSYNDMMARPDPPPYRTATLAFDTGGRIDYAVAAKARAQFEYGRVAVGDEAQQTTGRASSRSYIPDRHSGIH
jgi:hypothetical protein